jgi:hypothetical protein
MEQTPQGVGRTEDPLEGSPCTFQKSRNQPLRTVHPGELPIALHSRQLLEFKPLLNFSKRARSWIALAARKDDHILAFEHWL